MHSQRTSRDRSPWHKILAPFKFDIALLSRPFLRGEESACTFASHDETLVEAKAASGLHAWKSFARLDDLAAPSYAKKPARRLGCSAGA